MYGRDSPDQENVPLAGDDIGTYGGVDEHENVNRSPSQSSGGEPAARSPDKAPAFPDPPAAGAPPPQYNTPREDYPAAERKAPPASFGGGSPSSRLFAQSDAAGQPLHKKIFGAMKEFCADITAGPREDRRLFLTSQDSELIVKLADIAVRCRTAEEVEAELPAPVLSYNDKVLIAHQFGEVGDDVVDQSGGTDIFDKIDADHNGILSRSEFVEGLRRPDVIEYLAGRKSALQLLQNPAFVNKIWDLLLIGDEGEDLEVERNHFQLFIRLLYKKTLTYVEAAEHMRRRAFWGYGTPESECTPHAFWDESELFSSPPIDPPEERRVCGKLIIRKGWSEDLWYYLCQNHSLLSPLFSDVDHPLSQRERFVIEVVMWGYTFMMTTGHNWIAAGGLGEWFAVDGCASGDFLRYCESSGVIWASGAFPLITSPLGGFYALMFVSMPALVLNRLLFAMHLCPCVFGGRAQDDARAHGFVQKHMELLGRIVGVITVGLAVLFWFLGVTFWFEWALVPPRAIAMCLVYRIHTYVCQLVMIVLLQFCPFPVVDENGELRKWCKGPLGQWERERIEFARVYEAGRDDGDVEATFKEHGAS